MTAFAALCGALVGLGVWMLASGIRGTTAPQAEPGTGALSRVTRGPAPLYLAAVVVVAAVVGLLTRWPVGAILAGLGVWALPDFLSAERHRVAQVARLEAIASWTESLRDTLVAAAGLEQAIIATAPTAPTPIREQVTLLADAVRAGIRLPAALRAFGAALADPTGDLVVASLLLASTRAARNLADQLGALATATRDDVAARRRAEKGRAKAATDARIVMVTTLVMAVGLIVFNRSFLHPYDSLAGQLVLAVVGVLFAVGFRWLHKISEIPAGERVMALDDPTTIPEPTEVAP
jgi:tight adherence protein B